MSGGEGRGFGWGRLAAMIAAGGAVVGGAVAARRALVPPDERDGRPDGHGHWPEPFAERYREALENERLRGGVLRFQRNWRGGRDGSLGQYATDATLDEVVAGSRSFEELRQQLAATKDRVIDDPDRHFAQFKAAAERNGAIVYESSSTEDANRYIAELCRTRGITVIDKSKSMVTEETGLNHYLEERGVRVAETDLGEWL